MLLVEDNQLNAEIAAELLRMSGLTVDCAWDGIEAVDCLSSCPDGYYDMVFMDIQMPRMNGYDATRAIRSSARNYCKRVPIVAMTANAFAEDVQAAKTVGMNEHIAKPLELATLAAVLRRYLGGGDAFPALALHCLVGADGGVRGVGDVDVYSGAGRRGKGCPFPNPVCIPYVCFSHAWMFCFSGFASADATRGGFPIVTLTPSASSSLPHISKA